MVQLLRLASIISIAVATIKLGLAGLLTPAWAAFIMVCAVLILAGGRRVMIIVAAIAGLLLFARQFGTENSDAFASIVWSMLTLAIACFGLYIIFRGFFRNTNRY